MTTILRNISIDSVNSMEENNFVEVFGNVIESYPDAARAVSQIRPFTCRDDLINGLANYLDSLRQEEKQSVLQRHPDLAGRLADEGKLTQESTEEQKSAGLDKLEDNERKNMRDLNDKYKDKFGFPFVICARENKIASILEGFHTRLNNSWEEELDTGINEVKKICRLRVRDIVSE